MRLYGSSLLTVLAVLVPGVAAAADMGWGRGPVVVGEQAPYEEQIGTGWYLRGDLGYSHTNAPRADFDTMSLTGVKGGGAFVIGGGFGYKFSEYFRADVTVDQIGT